MPFNLPQRQRGEGPGDWDYRNTREVPWRSPSIWMVHISAEVSGGECCTECGEWSTLHGGLWLVAYRLDFAPEPGWEKVSRISREEF